MEEENTTSETENSISNRPMPNLANGTVDNENVHNPTHNENTEHRIGRNCSENPISTFQSDADDSLMDKISPMFPSPSDQHGSRNVVRLSLRSESPMSMESHNSISSDSGFQSTDSFIRKVANVPVLGFRGESFCDCLNSKSPSSETMIPICERYLNCLCGEENRNIEWTWESPSDTKSCEVSADGQHVHFNKEYSSGTAVVRGTKLLESGQNFWEIKMTSPVYGTDMMVGIGTPEIEMYSKEHQYCSFLGLTNESWGISYTGHCYHQGSHKFYGWRFGKGSIIGLHLDLWRGTLSLYKNHEDLGVVVDGLRDKRVYAMACSTAAHSSMKLINATSYASSLKFLCCAALRRYVPKHWHVLEALPIPPGLKDSLDRQLFWLLRPNAKYGKARTSNGSLIQKVSRSPRKSKIDKLRTECEHVLTASKTESQKRHLEEITDVHESGPGKKLYIS